MMTTKTIEFLPNNICCDIYLPETQTAIFVQDNNLKNVEGTDLNIWGKLRLNLLKEKCQNVIMIDRFELNKVCMETEPALAINKLEEMGIDLNNLNNFILFSYLKFII